MCIQCKASLLSIFPRDGIKIALGLGQSQLCFGVVFLYRWMFLEVAFQLPFASEKVGKTFCNINDTAVRLRYD